MLSLGSNIIRGGSLLLQGLLHSSARSCATTISAQEPCALIFPNKQFSRSLNLHLKDGEIYSLNFDNCSFDQEALEDLESLLINYDVQELNLRYDQSQNEGIPKATCFGIESSFLRMLCLSNLTQLDLSGIALTDNHLAILEKNLSSGKIKQIRMTIEPQSDPIELERVCRNLQIDLTISKASENPHPPKPLLATQNQTLNYVHLERQGGFDDYRHVKNRLDLIRMLPILVDGFCFTIIESSTDGICCIIFAIASGRGYIVPFNRPLSDMPINHVQQVLKQLLENPSIEKSCKNYRKYVRLLQHHNISLEGVVFDATSALNQWDSNAHVHLFSRIKKLFRRFEMRNIVPQPITVPSLETWEYQQAIKFASTDYKLRLVLTRLLKQRGELSYYCNITLPLEKLLFEIEHQGLRLDPAVLLKYIDFLKGSLSRTEKHIKYTIEMGSDNDLKVLTEDEKRIKKALKTLIRITERMNPESHLISIKHKQLNDFQRIVTYPNVNMPLFDEPSLCNAFIPNPDKRLYSLRFPSLPLRVLAQQSQDALLTSLCKTRNSEPSLRKAINRYLFKKEEFLTKTFLLNHYATGLIPKETLETSLQEKTQDFLNRYNEVFPGVKIFHDSLFSENVKTHTIRTEFGLRLARSKKEDPLSRIHTKIWGTANDYVSLFAIKLLENFKSQGLGSKIHSLRPLHILIDLKSEEESAVLSIAKKINSSLLQWSVPIIWQGGDWPNWGESEKKEDCGRYLLKKIPLTPSLDFQHTISLTKSDKTKNNLSSFDLESSLQKFGVSHLKPLQEQIILNVLNGQDAIALLPTGYGKSLCFQLPALLQEGITIVISPLISLIENQLDELKQKKIAAKWLRSNATKKELETLDQFKIVYITPEILVSDGFMDLLKNQKVSLFAVDEAHCIHQWGKTFRSSYRDLHCIREFFPKVPILALSASATPDVVQDISDVLQISAQGTVIGSFLRKNLSIHVLPRRNLTLQLTEFLDRHSNESGIVYCQKKKEVDQIHQLLVSKGYQAQKYHAGMSKEERSKVLAQFINDKCKIIVATVAFGMGVNKANVRFICHTKMPDSIERFYQEIGRSGRDLLPAECLLLYGHEDFILNCHLANILQEPSVKDLMLLKINQMYFFCHHQQCRQLTIAKYFNDPLVETCNNCDVCLKKIPTIDGTPIVKKIIQTIMSSNETSDVNYISRLLCNNEVESQQSKHNRISTLGCLSAFRPSEVKGLLSYLVHCGYLSLEYTDYTPKGSLSCNETTFEILRGDKKVQIFELEPIVAPPPVLVPDSSIILYEEPPIFEATPKSLKTWILEIFNKIRNLWY
ncbi:MAG: RecQ family ATP-dependent DNA helicase [Chlamydiales bacterium]